MLMAAGLGTRLQPFTSDLPKALLPVMGVPVAQFSIDLLERFRVPTIVANVHHLAAKAIEGLHDLGQIVVSDESKQLLGSAGGIVEALPHLGRRFFILNADVLCDLNLRELAQVHHSFNGRSGTQLTMVLFPRGPEGEVYREVLFDSVTGQVTGLGEKKCGGTFFTGVSIAEASIFESLEPGRPWEFVPDVLMPAIAKNQVSAYRAQGSWCDIGSPHLWWKTHLDLLKSLELGTLPPSWRQRIERKSKRLAPLWWCSKRTGADCVPRELIGPTYLDAPLERPKCLLGPRTVLYSGEGSGGGEPLRGGIGFGPHWIRCED